MISVNGTQILLFSQVESSCCQESSMSSLLSIILLAIRTCTYHYHVEDLQIIALQHYWVKNSATIHSTCKFTVPMLKRNHI